MNAYKCDICGKYFEDGIHKKGAKYLCNLTDKGHHEIIFRLAKPDDSYWPLFSGDICPDCMGYFCVGLRERGCQNDTVKMYAADYIRRCRDEMCTETLGAPVGEEAKNETNANGILGTAD